MAITTNAELKLAAANWLGREELTNRIPLNIDRYNSEKLYMANPQVAFVAHYSHPSVLQALRQ